MVIQTLFLSMKIQPREQSTDQVLTWSLIISNCLFVCFFSRLSCTNFLKAESKSQSFVLPYFPNRVHLLCLSGRCLHEKEPVGPASLCGAQSVWVGAPLWLEKDIPFPTLSFITQRLHSLCPTPFSAIMNSAPLVFDKIPTEAGFKVVSKVHMGISFGL